MHGLPQVARQVRVGRVEIPGATLGRVHNGHPRKLLRLLYRKGSEPHCVQKLKNSSIRANPQGQRKNRDGGKARASDKQTGTILQIIPDASQQPLLFLSANGDRRRRLAYGSFQSRHQFAVRQIVLQDSIGLLLADTGDEQLFTTIIEVLTQLLYELCFARCRKIQWSDRDLDLL